MKYEENLPPLIFALVPHPKTLPPFTEKGKCNKRKCKLFDLIQLIFFKQPIMRRSMIQMKKNMKGRLELTRFSLLLCGRIQLLPPRGKLQQPLNLIILKQIGPAAKHRSVQETISTDGGSSGGSDFAKPTGSGLEKRRTTRPPVAPASSLPPSFPQGSWHQSHHSAPPVGETDQKAQTGSILCLTVAIKQAMKMRN